VVLKGKVGTQEVALKQLQNDSLQELAQEAKTLMYVMCQQLVFVRASFQRI
jgi:hypothetical protein